MTNHHWIGGPNEKIFHAWLPKRDAEGVPQMTVCGLCTDHAADDGETIEMRRNGGGTFRFCVACHSRERRYTMHVLNCRGRH